MGLQFLQRHPAGRSGRARAPGRDKCRLLGLSALCWKENSYAGRLRHANCFTAQSLMFDPVGPGNANRNPRGQNMIRSIMNTVNLSRMSPRYGDHCPSREAQFFTVGGPGWTAYCASRALFITTRQSARRCTSRWASVTSSSSTSLQPSRKCHATRPYPIFSRAPCRVGPARSPCWRRIGRVLRACGGLESYTSASIRGMGSGSNSQFFRSKRTWPRHNNRCVEQIGDTAGVIWHHLNENGPRS